jgi:hypothetical protein
MSSDLNSFLSDLELDIVRTNDAGSDGTNGTEGVPFKEPGYDGTIDYRIRQLSYSSLLTLHNCPRKFELYKKRSTHRSEESESSTITFAFGHVVGQGIQDVMEGRSRNEVMIRAFAMWKPELFQIDTKQMKSFWLALQAIQKFISLRQQGFLEDYELVMYNGKPATELSFAISFPDGFRLRGFVDGVLRHRESGKILVLECKTTSSKANPATYKNSAQAIGYSVVLDVLFPELSAYDVLYLVYQTKDECFVPMPFPKSYLQRALWIQELLLDIEMIKLYENAQVYPMHGESCYSFFRECEYFQSCTLSTQYLTVPCTPAEEDKTEYQINVTLADLLEAQFAKTSGESDDETITEENQIS